RRAIPQLAAGRLRAAGPGARGRRRGPGAAGRGERAGPTGPNPARLQRGRGGGLAGHRVARAARRAPPRPHHGQLDRRPADPLHARGPDELPGGEEDRAAQGESTPEWSGEVEKEAAPSGFGPGAARRRETAETRLW